MSGVGNTYFLWIQFFVDDAWNNAYALVEYACNYFNDDKIILINYTDNVFDSYNTNIIFVNIYGPVLLLLLLLLLLQRNNYLKIYIMALTVSIINYSKTTKHTHVRTCVCACVHACVSLTYVRFANN